MQPEKITDNKPWPTEIRYKRVERVLHVTFNNDEVVSITAEYLRVESPSAEVQGHHPSEKITVTGKENVSILEIQPVGNYAVRIIFDDGHRTGIYTWDTLYNMGHASECN